MGNRAIITGTEDKSLGVYLHWNGGIESVYNFIQYAKLKGVRTFNEDAGYCTARLCQIIGNFFKGTLSVGVVTDCEDKTTDNDRYEIGDNWEIFHIKDGKVIVNAKPELDDIGDEISVEEWNESFMKEINKNMPDKVSGEAIKGAICK